MSQNTYSEEETLCAICCDTGVAGVTKYGTVAEVALNGLIKNVLVLTARLIIFAFFAWILKVIYYTF